MRWPSNTTRRRFVFTPDVVRKRPDDVLAHYHLGFAEGWWATKPRSSGSISVPPLLD